jgi:hypothetical protein
MKKLPEQDKLVAEYLLQRGIKSYSVFYAGKFNDGSWNADLWRITFTANNGKTFSTDFKTGLGHRIEQTNFSSFSVNDRKYITEVKTITGMDNVTHKTGEFGKQNELRAVAPTQASVLYCLLSDMQSAEYGYVDFCSNFGYDEDSRKALETYLACEKIGLELKRFFSLETIQHLQTLLEDY